MNFTVGQRVWWKHTDECRLFGTVEVLEERPGVRPDGDPDLLYLDAEQLHVGLPEGVHSGIPDDIYHADKTSLSASGAKLLLPPSVPAKFRQHMDSPPAPKPVFDFGHAVHTLVLTTGPELMVVDADDWRGKYAREQRDKAHADGKTPILAQDFDRAHAMEEAVREHPIAGDLFIDGEPETSLCVTDPDTGVRLRARPDWMTQRDGRLLLLDLKTTIDANPDTFGRSAHKWGYHIQCAWYVTVARMLELDESPAFLLVCVEKEPPYLVSVCEFDMDAYQLGKRQMLQAIRTYQECVESGVWPGYSPEIQALSLPVWAYSAGQQTIGDVSVGGL